MLERLTPADDKLFLALDALEAQASLYADGRARPEFRGAIEAFEAAHAEALAASQPARARLQGLQARCGLTTRHFPEIPLENEPFWLEGPDRFAGFQSTPELPAAAGLVIIGAGLSGSAAMHLALRHAENILAPAVRARLEGLSRNDARARFAATVQSEAPTVAFRASLERALEHALDHAEVAGERSKVEDATRRCVSDGISDAACVVVVDALDPCLGASGRNGGNRGLTENFEGAYEGLFEERVKLLAKSGGHDLSNEDLAAEIRERAEHETRFIITAWNGSRDIQGEILKNTGVDCDLKAGGWLKVAESALEEEALARDAKRLSSFDIPAKLLSREEIRAEYGIEVPFGGLRTRGETHHPVKYVRGVLDDGLARGGRLYTRTEVLGVDTTADGPSLRVRRDGAEQQLSAGLVFAATNAYTKSVFPEFTGIQPYRSQVAVYRPVPNVLGKLFFTRRQGDDYSNHPEPNVLIQGGGLDTPLADHGPAPVDPEVHALLVQYADEKIGPTPGLSAKDPEKRFVPPVSEWTGHMGFTPGHNKLPYAGALRGDVFLAGGYNGYGNTFAIYCVSLVVEQALFGRKSVWSGLLDPRA